MSRHHQYGKQKTFRRLISPKKGIMSRCQTNTLIGARVRQQVMALKKI
jgi:hypothetical protein